jgi:prepilin-type N-terminal cleavage/methylation domain-containing protein
VRHLLPLHKPRHRSDEGFTLVEILVTIVLMGTTMVAVLLSLQTTIGATVVDRDHATAFSWLQAASDEIYRVPRIPCTQGQAAAITAYDVAAKSVDRPPAWVDEPAAGIRVTTVEYLGKVSPDADFEWDAAYCFEGVGFETSKLYTQRVTIQVTSPNGELVKTLQMVKSE